MTALVDHRLWPARFSDKILIGEPDECWPWTAVLIPGGYGQFWYEGKMHNAHRIALLLGGLLLPVDHVVLHRCDNRKCCNPRHLRSAPQAENMKDMVAKGRSLRGERHGMARLKEEDVIAIRADRRPAQKIADQYGVKLGTILDVRYRRSWVHIP